MFRKLVLASLISLMSYPAMAGKDFQEFNPNLYEKIDGKYAMKNQLLVAFLPGPETSSQFASTLTRMGLKVLSSQTITSNSANIKIMKIQLKSQQSLKSLRTLVEKMQDVQWVQPNYIYNINKDPREDKPNDPMLTKQYHHQTVENLKAWDISTGKNVLLAVTDDGFDVNHEDLSSRFIPKGYNFCNNNTNVAARGNSGRHGTHVSGIIAAELNNGKGGAGTAGDANVLPIKFYGESCDWTSELIYKAYQYAADNNVKIISTSYNIDGFVGDKTFVAGLDYVYNKGVLHFNSAGNNDEKDPPRQAFEEVILVASTNEQDIRSDFSNYGSRVQISAPGEDILSTTPGNNYESMSGTSMATPNAAASAALIWSAHPTWSRDQVAAQLIGTADNIDNKNPNYKGLLGSGRINNYRALTEKLSPAKITEVEVTSSGIAVHFDKLLDPNVVNKGNHWEIKSLNDGSIIPASLEQPWLIGSTTLKLAFANLSPGKYQLTIKDSLKDPFGQAFDGDANGVAGGNYVYVFEK